MKRYSLIFAAVLVLACPLAVYADPNDDNTAVTKDIIGDANSPSVPASQEKDPDLAEKPEKNEPKEEPEPAQREFQGAGEITDSFSDTTDTTSVPDVPASSPALPAENQEKEPEVKEESPKSQDKPDASHEENSQETHAKGDVLQAGENVISEENNTSRPSGKDNSSADGSGLSDADSSGGNVDGDGEPWDEEDEMLLSEAQNADLISEQSAFREFLAVILGLLTGILIAGLRGVFYI